MILLPRHIDTVGMTLNMTDLPSPKGGIRFEHGVGVYVLDESPEGKLVLVWQGSV